MRVQSAQMISLKKFIDLRYSDSPPDADGMLCAYQAALAAMGVSGQKAIPVLGTMLRAALTRIGDNLNRSASTQAVCESTHAVEEQLTLWADKAQQNQEESEQTIRQLLLVILDATESSGLRDEKFSGEMAELGNRLRAVAVLDNLPAMRRSIAENAGALTSCVARMADQGRESVRKLNSEIVEYQTRLLASERRALVDLLTGLCNRRGFEQQLELRVERGQPFSLLVADLNGFKAANDRYGHVVGDEILKQFGGELKIHFPAEDTLARWGGDEFVGIVSGPAREGEVRAERVRHWVLGEYRIKVANQTIAVMVDAAVGTIAWDGVESGLELFARADKEMYRIKRGARELV